MNDARGAAPATSSTVTLPAAAADPLAQLGKRRRRRWPWWLLALLVVVALVAGALALRRAPTAHEYITGVVSRGDVVQTVEATGTVNAITSVQVSSQVSGRVVSLGADWNQVVHTGDVLAQLDPLPFRAQVSSTEAQLEQARASARRAEADLTLARTNATRARSMLVYQLSAQSDVDTAVAAEQDAIAQLALTRAAVEQAQAALTTAQANLDYATIRSPMDGIVLSRSVDVGATVAASLNAPTLFQIVDDLSRVQVLGNVDESEIGLLHEGMPVQVTVEAFPDDVFDGRVIQLRFDSTLTQGVVTYPAIIEVENPRHQLRPGMTAVLTVHTAQISACLRVPNAALRFQPADASRPAATVARGSHGGTVWVLDGSATTGSMRAVPITTGITDGRDTQVVTGDLVEGAVVVLDDGVGTGAGAAASTKRGPRMF